MPSAEKSLRGQRVLVTGGAGFVGSHIVDLLVEEGCERIAVVDNLVRGRRENLDAALASGRVELVEGDIRNNALMAKLVASSDTVFHQAALRITHCAAEPDAAMSVMVDATYQLLKLCVAAKVGKVVMASSASIYGMADQFPTEETGSPYANRTLYGVAKGFGEGLLRAFNDMYGLNYVALRYFNVYGPRMDLHGRYTEVMVRWMERIAANLPPTVFGDGTQTLDLIHVRDVARANLLAARLPVTDGVFNVGSQTETSLAALAQKLTVAMGRPHLKPVHAEERAINPVPRRLASGERAWQHLHFRPQISLHDGLRDLVDWWEQQAEMTKEAQAS